MKKNKIGNFSVTGSVSDQKNSRVKLGKIDQSERCFLKSLKQSWEFWKIQQILWYLRKKSSQKLWLLFDHCSFLFEIFLILTYFFFWLLNLSNLRILSNLGNPAGWNVCPWCHKAGCYHNQCQDQDWVRPLSASHSYKNGFWNSPCSPESLARSLKTHCFIPSIV